MAELFGFDAYSPKEIAERVENIGVTKARLPLLTVATLGVLAGGFIGLGALYFTLVTSDSSLSFAASRLLGGLTFSLGLILVVVAGAELFTGNNLLVMAWASRRITTKELITNWLIVYLAKSGGRAGLGFSGRAVRPLADGEQCGGAKRREDRCCKAALSFLGGLFQRNSVQHFGLSGRLAGAGGAKCGSIRSSPSFFPYRRSSLPASSTASPTCTSYPWG